jgi:hypothetical protein
MIIFSEHATVGFFWLNAAEGWIDVNNDKLSVTVSPRGCFCRFDLTPER